MGFLCFIFLYNRLNDLGPPLGFVYSYAWESVSGLTYYSCNEVRG